ncbi:MAG: winged helix-turn-helix domain-containing protein [Proteobacteria bacterium]|nr:winged helix-turn-helix domain-containing protein [Pseudomonadota bacterium]MCP4921735.1 winged helix-turn-helix domain-containing protein [Pseudomonadota bacterium]
MRTLTPAQARRFLVGQAGLFAIEHPRGHDGVRALLERRRCIQLDPLDPIGTNADLVALARVDGIRRGDVYDALLPGHAFEHFAKERCLLPATAFPHYAGQAVETPWWRLQERMKRVPSEVIEAVFDEVSKGPLQARDLPDYGRVAPIDWSGWKSTSKAGSMALRILWTRCRIVVHSRAGRQKVYSLPEVSLGDSERSDEDFDRWALLERVEAAGMLAESSGPWWSMLASARKSGLRDELVDEGLVQRVTVEGSRRTYLAPAGFLSRERPDPDGRMRVLGPLDPLIWDRKLIGHAFGFEYLWEVYKPADKRRWGWYVCPLLLGDRLVGRVEAHVDEGRIVIDNVWREDGWDEAAFEACMHRHEQAIC